MALPFPVPPGLLHPDFTLAHAAEPDAEAAAELYHGAFQTDPGNTYWWPGDREAMLGWMAARTRRKMADRSMRHFKVADARTGEMVAFARWGIPRGSAAFGEWLGGDGVNGEAAASLAGGADAPQPPSSAALDLPRGADPELCRGFFDGLVRMSSRWMAEDMLCKQLAREGGSPATGAASRALANCIARPLADCDVDKAFQAGRRQGADGPHAGDCRRRGRQDLS